jgi:hypothetical protein
MFGKLLEWLSPAPFAGIVIAKNSFAAAGTQNRVPAAQGNKSFNSVANEGIGGSWVVAQDDATFYLIVQGAGGKKKSIIVEENTYNNTEIGDKWPSTSNQ